MVKHATKNHTRSTPASCTTDLEPPGSSASHRCVDSNPGPSEPEARARACTVTPQYLQNQIGVFAVIMNLRSSRLIAATRVSCCSCLGEGIISHRGNLNHQDQNSYAFASRRSPIQLSGEYLDLHRCAFPMDRPFNWSSLFMASPKAVLTASALSPR